MKNKTVVALIVAAILIFTGGILFILGISYAGGSKDMVSHTEQTYVVDAPFENIRVDATVCDVTLKKTDGAFKAVCPEYKTLDYTVIVEDNTLHLRQVDLRQWYDFIGINLKYQEITLYLPESQYDALRVETDTGRITLPDSFTFSSGELLTSTGDIECGAQVTENLSVHTSTGDIQVRGCTPARVEISTSTGNVELENIACGDCFVKTTTGRIAVTGMECQSLECQSSTGDKVLHQVTAEKDIRFTSTTGDVELSSVLTVGDLLIQTDTGDVDILGCDAENVGIQTDTGHVIGSFLTSKWFQVSSDTGNISVPMTREGGECRIETDTGDIIFS